MESADGSALIRRHRVVLQTAAADQGLPRPSAPPGAHNFRLWALRILIGYPAATHPSTPLPTDRTSRPELNAHNCPTPDTRVPRADATRCAVTQGCRCNPLTLVVLPATRALERCLYYPGPSREVAEPGTSLDRLGNRETGYLRYGC